MILFDECAYHGTIQLVQEPSLSSSLMWFVSRGVLHKIFDQGAVHHGHPSTIYSQKGNLIWRPFGRCLGSWNHGSDPECGNHARIRRDWATSFDRRPQFPFNYVICRNPLTSTIPAR